MKVQLKCSGIVGGANNARLLLSSSPLPSLYALILLNVCGFFFLFTDLLQTNWNNAGQYCSSLSVTVAHTVFCAELKRVSERVARLERERDM